MTQRILSAPKYQVSINPHLVGEVLDHMQLSSSQRGVVAKGLNAIKLAIDRANEGSKSYGVTLKALSDCRRSTSEPLALYELLFILDDPDALEDVRTYGSIFCQRFGPKTENAIRDFVEAVCDEVNRGFFRI